MTVFFSVLLFVFGPAALFAQPVITLPPADQAVFAGTNATLLVSADGTPPLTYQWRFNGNDLPAANEASLTLTNVQLFHAGNYQVVVSNAGGAVTSAPAMLHVAFVPDVLWARQAGGTNNYESGNSVAVDAAGNVYVAGEFSGTAMFGTNTLVAPGNPGWSDMFLAKYSRDGELAWVKQFGSVYGDGASAVAVDTAGDVLVTGWFETNVWFDSILVTNINPSAIWSDIFIAKFDAAGNVLWARNAGGGADYDYAAAMALQPNGDPILTGYFRGTGRFGGYTFGGYGNEEYFVAQYSRNNGSVLSAGFGTSQGTCGAPAGYDRGEAVAVDAAGRCYVGGVFSGTNLNFFTGESIASPSCFPYQGFFARYNSAGGLDLASRQTNISFIWDMAGAAEGVYACGNGFSVARLDATGNAIWTAAAGGDALNAAAYGVATDGSGSVLVAGSFHGTNISFPGVTFSVGGSTNRCLLACYRPDGEFRWARQFGGQGQAEEIAVDYADFAYVTGSFSGEANFGVHTLTSSGGSDVFVARLGVLPPALLDWPGAQTIYTGESNVLAVTAVGEHPLNYQWRLNGTNLPGATNSAVLLAEVQLADAGVYSVVVSNAFGVAVSPGALLNVITGAPIILVQPQSQVVTSSMNFTFSVVATNSLPLYYQWRLNATNLDGATASQLVLTNVRAHQAGDYSVVITNDYGSVTSAPAMLTVMPLLPAIVVQPQGVTATEGAEVLLRVTAVGDEPLTYQWHHDGAPVIFGTNAVLQLTNTQPEQVGAYFAIVTNPFGSATSTVVNVAVSAPPGFLWARRGGGGGLDAGNATAVDAAGNVFFAGSFSGTATFGSTNLTSAGSTDVFVAKYDPTGNLLWLRQGSSSGEDAALGVATDNNGNVYVSGYFMFIANFSGLFATNFNPSLGNRDVFVAKYNADGDALWVKRFGAGSHDQGNGIAVTPAGEVLVAGQFQGTVNFGGTNLASAGNNEMFLLKLDPAGDILWAKRAGGTSEDYGQSVATDSSGNAIVTGYYVSSSINVDGIILTNVGSAPGRAEILLAKYNGSGALLWARKAGGLQDDQGRGVCTDALGNIFLTGHFASAPATFESLTISNLSSSIDVFLAKYDRDGNILWLKSAAGTGSDYGHAVATDAGGNCYLAGRFSGSFNLGFTNLSGGGTYAFVAAYSAVGNGLWARRAGGGGQDQPNGIALDRAGNAYLALQSASSTAQFGHILFQTLGGSDAYLAKLATVDPVAPPGVTLHPSNQVAVAGANVTLSAGYTGGHPVSIQWRFNGANLPGATSLLLTLANAMPALAGNYSFVLSNANGVVTSGVATVTVNIEPDFRWALGGGGSSQDEIRGVVCDTNGNTYVCGYFTGEFSFAGTNLVSAGGEDIFIAKFDSQTNLVWIQQAGGSGDDRANAIMWDRYLGSVLVAGQFSGTADFSGLARTSGGGADMFLASYRASDGLRGWVLRGGGAGEDVAHGIVLGKRIQSYSDLYVTGSFQGSAQFSGSTLNSAGTNDIFLAHYYSSGENFLGAVSAGGTGDDRGRAVSCDPAGNVFMAGAFSGTASFSGTNLTSSAGYDVCLVKYDSSLTRLWARKAGTSLPPAGGGTYHDEATAVAADAYGNVFVAGNFIGQATFGAVTKVSTSTTQPDVFLAKYDANGAVLWAQSAGGAGADAATSLAVDLAGNAWMAGSFTAPASFNPFIPTSAGGAEALLAMYDATGRLLKLRRAGSALDDMAWSVASDHAGNAVFGGTHGAAGAGGGFALDHAGARDAFVAKVSFFTPGLPPVITSQPISVVVSNGLPASLGVGVLSSTAVSYQWFFNGAPLAGATNNTLAFASVSFANLGSYSVTVSNAFGTITSDAATMRIEQPPEVLWTLRQGSTGDDQALAVATDAAGNVYAAGLFSGTVAFGTSNLMSVGNTDIFLAKYNPQGGLLWARRYGGTGADGARVLQVDSTGDIYFAGYFFSLTASFGSFTLTNRSAPAASYSDLFVARCDPEGNLLWVRAGGGSWNPNFVNHNDVATALATDAAGNAYLTGSFHSSGVFGSLVLSNLNTTNFFLAKYDPAGNVLWARTTTGVNISQGSGVCVDATTNVYVTGHLFGSLNLGSGVITNTNFVSIFGNGTVFVAKYDSSGALQWAKPGGTNGLGYGQAIAADAAGNIFATSYRLSYGGGVMLTKYDGAGTVLWWRTNSVSCCTGDYISAAGLALDPGGNPVIAGYLNGSIQNQTNFYVGGYVLKYRSDGGSQWFQRCASSAANGTAGAAVAVDAQGNFHVAGRFTGNSFFGASSNLVSAGGNDAFLVKFGIRPPTITTLPGDQLVTTGSNATLLVSTAGAPANYQWQFNGANLPGATNPTLALNHFNFTRAGRYSVVIQSAAGWATSAVAGVGLIPVLQVAPASNGVALNWDGDFTLQSALDISGPYADLLTGYGPYTQLVAAAEGQRYFRLRVSCPDLNGIMQPDGLALSFSGSPGRRYTLLSSTNLTDWDAVTTDVFPFALRETDLTRSPQKFFRARLEP